MMLDEVILICLGEGSNNMANYNLQPNESIIMKSDRVSHKEGIFSAYYTDELILTNLNIVLISKGAFGNTKNIQTYPVNQIKVFNGQAQAILAKQKNGSSHLEVYFLNGQESFGFENKKEINRWVDNINQLVTGNPVDIQASESKAIPGTEYIAETLKDTVDTFKEAFGLKTKTNISKSVNSTPAEKVAKQCTACGASISGHKGQIVNCQYCDTKQQL
jgi:hypothetical protein